MKPLIKWPGGKSGELARLRPLLPAYERFIEPFAGGAAFFFDQEPRAGVLNDINSELIDLYRLLGAQSPATREAFSALAAAWEGVTKAALLQSTQLSKSYRKGGLDLKSEVTVDKYLQNVRKTVGTNVFLDSNKLDEITKKTFIDKVGRLGGLEKKAVVSDVDLGEQVATGLIAGFYTFMRDAFVPKSAATKVATFWFLREMCYGSMFRFNKAGKFNIPYGGASYNRKDLRGKIDTLLSPQTKRLLASTQLSSDDFRIFFEKLNGGKKTDLVFLDPPYDSEFSDYANHPFGMSDQEALAKNVAALKGQVMLVVKRTPLTWKLYSHLAKNDKRFHLTTYDEVYGYNVRGRNARETRHLCLTSYELPKVAKLRK